MHPVCEYRLLAGEVVPSGPEVVQNDPEVVQKGLEVVQKGPQVVPKLAVAAERSCCWADSYSFWVPQRPEFEEIFFKGHLTLGGCEGFRVKIQILCALCITIRKIHLAPQRFSLLYFPSGFFTRNLVCVLRFFSAIS